MTYQTITLKFNHFPDKSCVICDNKKPCKFLKTGYTSGFNLNLVLKEKVLQKPFLQANIDLCNSIFDMTGVPAIYIIANCELEGFYNFSCKHEDDKENFRVRFVKSILPDNEEDKTPWLFAFTIKLWENYSLVKKLDNSLLRKDIIQKAKYYLEKMDS